MHGGTMAELGRTKSLDQSLRRDDDQPQTGVSPTPINRTPTAKYRRTADVSPRKAVPAKNEIDEFRIPKHLQTKEAFEKRAVISPTASQQSTYLQDHGLTTGRLRQFGKVSKTHRSCS